MIHARQDLVVADGRLKRRAGEGEDDPFAARAVGFERLAPLVPDNAPGIHLPAAIDVKLHRLGPESPGAAAQQAFGAPGRFDMAVNVNALIEIQAAIRPPAEGMDDVVRVFGAEAGEHDPPLVGLARAGGVLEMKTLRCCWRRSTRRRRERCRWG